MRANCFAASFKVALGKNAMKKLLGASYKPREAVRVVPDRKSGYTAESERVPFLDEKALLSSSLPPLHCPV